jgi:hypothetical protein
LTIIYKNYMFKQLGPTVTLREGTPMKKGVFIALSVCFLLVLLHPEGATRSYKP